jgi:hypothetical protein
MTKRPTVSHEANEDILHDVLGLPGVAEQADGTRMQPPRVS